MAAPSEVIAVANQLLEFCLNSKEQSHPTISVDPSVEGLYVPDAQTTNLRIVRKCYSKMLSRLFHAHGQMCASRPWEVIFGTITATVCLMSMSMFATSHKICGYNYKCTQQDVSPPDIKSSDIIILTIMRCLAVVYIYLHFRNLRKLGSKYLLGIAGLFTVFSSFVFSIAVINLLGDDLTGLNEALPFFLLLVDLSRASTLARFALSSTSQVEVGDNIARGMAIIGPSMTLDAIVEILVIGVGTLSGVKQIETMCCFGCVSVVANYLAFMTFFPACLALFLELSHDHHNGVPVWQLRQVTKIFQEEEDEKPNPVTQRIKIIMSVGLMVVHAHSHWIAGFGGSGVQALDGDSTLTRYIIPDKPLWQFMLKKNFPPSMDYIITVVLALILGIKYVLYDSEMDASAGMPLADPANSPGMMDRETGCQPITQSEIKATSITLATGCDATDKTVVANGHPAVYDISVSKKPSFIIGDYNESDSDVDSDSKQMVDTATQTECVTSQTEILGSGVTAMPCDVRTLDECVAIMKSDMGPSALSDTELLMLVKSKHLPAYKLERMLGDHERGISVRRQLIGQSLAGKEALTNLPYINYDYKYVDGACCENVLGYVPVPVGVAGPLLMNDKNYHVPMATTEGCLVASTNRGCRAISLSGGAKSFLIGNGMTRAPVVRFPSAGEAVKCKLWLEDSNNFDIVAESFNSTTRYGHLKNLHMVQAARNLYIRFIAHTADAMGMNMMSKGSEKAMAVIQQHFPNMEIMALSGNFCTDKKPSAINWIEGRGKSVVCEAVIPSHIVETVLKTSVHHLVDLNISKNLMGSAMAGSIGGFNAHAANIVTAIYIATGQDPAQNVVSSNCMTVMEASGEDKEDLYISCTMPSIEVGTVGGGTMLLPQAACLQMLGVHGSNVETPGNNADILAMVVCSTVMAGELSLMSALAAGHLVRSHLKHNRSALNVGTQKTSPSKKQEPSTCKQKVS